MDSYIPMESLIASMIRDMNGSNTVGSNEASCLHSGKASQLHMDEHSDAIGKSTIFFSI